MVCRTCFLDLDMVSKNLKELVSVYRQLFWRKRAGMCLFGIQKFCINPVFFKFLERGQGDISIAIRLYVLPHQNLAFGSLKQTESQ